MGTPVVHTSLFESRLDWCGLAGLGDMPPVCAKKGLVTTEHLSQLSGQLPWLQSPRRYTLHYCGVHALEQVHPIRPLPVSARPLAKEELCF